MNQRDYARLNITALASAIVRTRWYQFAKRRRLHNQAVAIAKAWCIKY